jgi:phospholipid/cholesterol/gamma-HCH transport system substrate-binding protein
MATLSERRRLLTTCAAAVLAGSLTSCSMGLDRIPLPAPNSARNTYSISATFDNALNLPHKAKVRMSGADIGEVESMVARDYTAVVAMRIDSEVQIPRGTAVELRSATPLGDVFVSLKPPAAVVPGGPMLQPGETIPLDATGSASTVEDVLSTASLLVNGGAVRNLTKVINGMGEAVAGKGESLDAFLDESTRLVQSLSARSDAVKASLSQTDELAATLSARQDSINEAIVAAGPAFETVADNTGRIVDTVGQMNRTTLQLAKFPSIRGEESRSMVADMNRLAAGINAASQVPDPTLNTLNKLFGPILKLTNSTASSVDIDLADLAVGAFADPYHPADPGSHAPTREDFRNMVGSITYQLTQVRNKFWGFPTAPPGNVPPPDLIGPGPQALTPPPPAPPLLPPPTPAPVLPLPGGTP